MTVTVFVMHVLIRKKSASDQLFHDFAMLKNLLLNSLPGLLVSPRLVTSEITISVNPVPTITRTNGSKFVSSLLLTIVRVTKKSG